MLVLLSLLVTLPPAQKLPMRDFIGLNVHTTSFRPDLYAPVTSVVRDYHGVDWDLGDRASNPATFPNSRNGVNWQNLYGTWNTKGYRIDVTAQCGGLKPDQWNPTNDFAYGESFARYFGPSGDHKLVDSFEIGNEPADFTEPQYREMYENMAKGIRKGDPKLKIVTCAVAKGKEDKYSKDVACLEGLESLIDVINVHTYAFVTGWPTWLRSFPEDPKINYLKQVDGMIEWRNQHAPGKPVWVTEFGYDSTTKPNKTTGDFAKWIGNTDSEQAEYIVRSYLVFSAMDIQKAYLYYFNDDDEPQLHGSSGLTRKYVPKPSFYAVAHLQKTLGNYRFDKVIQKDDNVYAYQYRNGDELIWAVWSPTGSGKSAQVQLPKPPGRVVKSEKMPQSTADPATVPFKVSPSGVDLTIGEAPVYLWIKA